MSTTIPEQRTDVAHLAAFSVLTIATAANSSGWYRQLGDRPGDAPQNRVLLAAGDTKTFGPFVSPKRFEVACDTGTVTYDSALADPLGADSNLERTVRLTQSEYDALDPPDAKTLYVVVG